MTYTYSLSADAINEPIEKAIRCLMRGEPIPVTLSLDSSELRDLLAEQHQIAIVWGVEDVQEIRPGLTDEQAWEVLLHAAQRHDANYGLTWLTLEFIADDLFGDAPDDAGEAGQP